MEDDSAPTITKIGQRIALLTPRSLQKFTSGILAKGLSQLGIDLVPLSDATTVIAVLTPKIGAFDSRRVMDDTTAIMGLLEKAQMTKPQLDLVVTFRPELVSSIPLPYPDAETVSCIQQMLREKALLGAAVTVNDHSLHSEPTSVGSTNRNITALPHGFFSSAPPTLLKGRVIVGTHSYPGEATEVLPTLHGILEILSRTPAGSCIGYLGGKTAPQLTCEAALEIARTHFSSVDIEVVPNYFMVADAERKRVLVVSDEMWEPDEYCVTFDLRHMKEGNFSHHIESLHLRSSLPIVPGDFAKRYLGARPIISYSDSKDRTYIQKVIESIQSKKVPALLKEAERFAKSLTPKRIGELYSGLIRMPVRELSFDDSESESGVH